MVSTKSISTRKVITKKNKLENKIKKSTKHDDVAVKIKKQKLENDVKTPKKAALVNKIKQDKDLKIPMKAALVNTINNKEKVDLRKKKVNFVMPSKYITESIVESSLNALEQVAACTKNKNAIFEDEQHIFAEIHCMKIQTSRGNIKFVLPHSTAASTGEICLITPDIKKGRKLDHEPTVDYWEEILRKANVTSVKTVLPMRQLRVENDQFELKRRLLTQHDFIMVDTRVMSHVSHVLGKMFFKKHNMMIPVRLNEKKNDVKQCIENGLRTTMLRLGEGPTSVILVGHTGMPKEKLKENIISLVQQLREKYPGGEANIRSIALKLPLSLSVPIYITLRSSNTIANPPKIGKRKPKNFRDILDELSTINNGIVRVAPDGTVRIIKQKISETDTEAQSEEDEPSGNDKTSDKEE